MYCISYQPLRDIHHTLTHERARIRGPMPWYICCDIVCVWRIQPARRLQFGKTGVQVDFLGVTYAQISRIYVRYDDAWLPFCIDVHKRKSSLQVNVLRWRKGEENKKLARFRRNLNRRGNWTMNTVEYWKFNERSRVWIKRIKNEGTGNF